MKPGLIPATKGLPRVLGVALVLGVGALIMGAAVGAHGQTESVLYSFSGRHDGSQPYGSLVLDAAGNLYGTTYERGHYGYGSVFKLAPIAGGGWHETLIYSFKGGKDSGFPWAGLTMDPEGNLYGTTTDDDGLHGYGTVFKLTPSAGGSWEETILYTFRGGEDGGIPFGRLILDPSGNLYGTAYEGGNLSACNASHVGCGVVFALSPSSSGDWKETVLYAFQSGNDGAFPEAGVIFDRAGNLYGTTGAGGGSPTCSTGCGVAYELSRTPNGAWRETVLHSFSLDSDGSDSMRPWSSTAPGTSMAPLTAAIFSPVTVVEVAAAWCLSSHETPTASWQESVLHSFTGGSDDRSNPAEGGLALDAAGNLWRYDGIWWHFR